MLSGISNTQTSGNSVSSKEIDEISTGIIAGAKVGASASATAEFSIPGIASGSATAEASVEASVETSVGGRFSTEVDQSWLSESSSTWSKKTTKTITIKIPPNKCMGLYQKIGHYGPYEVGGTKTISRERTPKSFECFRGM